MSGSAASSAALAVRDVLRNRPIRRLELAWTAGTAADWAFLVVLLVVAYEAGGTLAVGILGAVRVVPAIVAAPFATTLVERFRGDRVLTAINVVRGAGAVATAVAVGVDLPMAVVYVLAGLVAGAGSLVRPIQYALLPALARTPGELIASNVASSLGEGIGTFAGPLLAGVLVASTGSVEASVLIAAIFAGAAAAATGVRFEREVDARGGTTARAASRLRLVDAPAVLRRYPGASVVVADFVMQVFVRGILIALTVVLSIELLELGDGGVGLLNAAIGLGGLLGALGALGLAGGSRLGTVFAIALAGWGLPLVLIGAWPVVAFALVALFVTGVSNAVLDVSGFTLVQRGVATEDRVTMFGVMEALFGLGLLFGSLTAPALVALAGERGAFVVAGAILPLCALLTWRPIGRHAERDTANVAYLALLRRNALFAPLPLTALDRLAESLEARTYEPGEVVMQKGEAGDHYLVIEDGEIDVGDDGRPLATLGPGEGLGEIALLRSVPRTATATARTAVRGYAIAGPAFLAAVAGPAAAVAVEAVVSARLARSQTTV
jgi:Cyclic nucleotide-binding domain